MRLSPGSILGRYEIVSPIGAGGMGEVYRARDTRLERDVAIKVLPPTRAEDATALARFEREAQAVAALSHPNILAIHDVGHQDGLVYAVSELLEGETLGQRLAAGPLPASKAIEYGVQIARGLGAAHGRGVVHRDLKPENIFLTRDGQAKILDFGLAKTTAPPAPGVEDRTLTRIAAHTDPGTVMGTVGYMSPEQVRGQPADHRSDIFTLGAILHEMLTGRRAFAGASAADTFSAVLNEDPQGLGESAGDLPPNVELLIRRCLEKNPEERFQSARDLAFALERLSSLTVVSTPLPAAATTRRTRRRKNALAALALLLVVAALTAAFLLGQRSATVETPTFQQLTFRRGTIRSARVAPDGQTVVYGAAWDGEPIRIYTTRAGSPASQRLDLPDADILAVSSRGELAVSVGRTFLAPNQSTGTLARVPLAGGVPKLVLENTQEADWSPDGNQLAVVHEVEGHNRLEYPIGTVLHETVGWIDSPRVSPDGQRIAFIDHDLRWDDAGWIAVVDLEGNVERLTGRWSSAQGLAWSDSGEEIWFTASAASPARGVHAVTLKGRQRVVYRQANALTLLDLLPDGQVLLASTILRREARFGSDGEERDLSWLDWSLTTFLSRDGSTVLVSEQGGGAEADYSIYLRKTDGSPPVHIGSGTPMALSPDGERVLAGTGNSERKLVVYSTGPGTPREIAAAGVQSWGGWFPDGRRILFSTGGGGEPFRLFLHEIGGETRQISEGSYRLEPFSDPVSPDGKRFFARSLGGTAALFSLEAGGPEPIPGLEPSDTVIRWSRNGRWLYFYQQGMPAPYGRIEVATGRRELLGELAPFDRAGAVGIWPVIVSADGNSYAYSYPRYLGDLYLVEGLR